MSTTTKLVSSALAALTLVGAVTATSAPAEARGFPAAGVAGGIIGAVALGAIVADAYAPRRTYVAHRRHGRHYPCGCVVRIGAY